MESAFSNPATANVIALVALIVAGGALALEIRRWAESGPRLRMSIMADATMFPHDDGRRRAVLTVTNTGSAPTQITHMILFAYPSPLHRWLDRKRLFGGFINEPQAAPQFQIPYRLDVGDRWLGMMLYDEDLLTHRANGRLYIGVHASHSRRAFLMRVPRELPAMEEVQNAGGGE